MAYVSFTTTTGASVEVDPTEVAAVSSVDGLGAIFLAYAVESYVAVNVTAAAALALLTAPPVVVQFATLATVDVGDVDVNPAHVTMLKAESALVTQVFLSASHAPLRIIGSLAAVTALLAAAGGGGGGGSESSLLWAWNETDLSQFVGGAFVANGLLGIPASVLGNTMALPPILNNSFSVQTESAGPHTLVFVNPLPATAYDAAVRINALWQAFHPGQTIAYVQDVDVTRIFLRSPLRGQTSSLTVADVVGTPLADLGITAGTYLGDYATAPTFGTFSRSDGTVPEGFFPPMGAGDSFTVTIAPWPATPIVFAGGEATIADVCARINSEWQAARVDQFPIAFSLETNALLAFISSPFAGATSLLTLLDGVGAPLAALGIPTGVIPAGVTSVPTVTVTPGPQSSQPQITFAGEGMGRGTSMALVVNQVFTFGNKRFRFAVAPTLAKGGPAPLFIGLGFNGDSSRKTTQAVGVYQGPSLGPGPTAVQALVGLQSGLGAFLGFNTPSALGYVWAIDAEYVISGLTTLPGAGTPGLPAFVMSVTATTWTQGAGGIGGCNLVAPFTYNQPGSPWYDQATLPTFKEISLGTSTLNTGTLREFECAFYNAAVLAT